MVYKFIQLFENVHFKISCMSESSNKLFKNAINLSCWHSAYVFFITYPRSGRTVWKLLVHSYSLTHKYFLKIVITEQKNNIVSHIFLLLLVLQMVLAKQKNRFVIALSVHCSSQAFLSATVMAGVAFSAQFTSLLLLCEHRMNWLREFILMKFGFLLSYFP